MAATSIRGAIWPGCDRRASNVSIGFGRTATQDLTHVGLVLSPRRARGRWLAWWVLLVGALVTGASIGYVGRGHAPPGVQQPPVGAAPRVQILRQQLEQTRLALRLADARGQELEHQID